MTPERKYASAAIVDNGIARVKADVVVQRSQEAAHISISLPPARSADMTVIHGDSRAVMPTIPPDALVVTDPPYNIGYAYDEYKDALPVAAYESLLTSTLRPPCVVIHYPEELVLLGRILGKPRRVVCWVYNGHLRRQSRAIAWFGCAPDFTRAGQPYKNPNDRRIRPLIQAGRRARLYDWWLIEQVKGGSHEKTAHPCQIPIEVMRRILQITPTQLVVDPFCGAGSTLVAARELGISAMGIEISANYCRISRERLGLVGDDSQKVEKSVAVLGQRRLW